MKKGESSVDEDALRKKLEKEIRAELEAEMKGQIAAKKETSAPKKEAKTKFSRRT